MDWDLIGATGIAVCIILLLLALPVRGCDSSNPEIRKAPDGRVLHPPEASLIFVSAGSHCGSYLSFPNVVKPRSGLTTAAGTLCRTYAAALMRAARKTGSMTPGELAATQDEARPRTVQLHRGPTLRTREVGCLPLGVQRSQRGVYCLEEARNDKIHK